MPYDNLDPRFADAVRQFLAAAPGGGITINSGYRTPERQAQLWAGALAKYGSPEAARKWVAPPGRSMHNHGVAADLGYASPAVRDWAHTNAANYGLAFPLPHENWHIELAGARGQPRQEAAPVQVAGAAAPPQPATAPAGPAGPVNPAMTAALAMSAAAPLADLFQPDPEQERKRRADEERRRRLALFG